MKMVTYFEAAVISNFQLFVQNAVEIYVRKVLKPPEEYLKQLKST